MKFGNTLPGIGRNRRTNVAAIASEPAKASPHENIPFVTVVRPQIPTIDTLIWARNNRDSLLRMLQRYGALLLRGFEVKGAAVFREVFEAITGQVTINYEYGSTPRTNVADRVYTSTEYPADSTIPLHHEMSYTRRWPEYLGFFSVHAAKSGGETLLADGSAIYQSMPTQIRQKLGQKGVLYTRSFHDIDVPWQRAFGTEDPAEALRFCSRHGIVAEWTDVLRTREVCQAWIRHPRTGRFVWFNQAHLFHVSSAGEEAASALVDAYGVDGLPRNALLGDGTEFEIDDLLAIRATLETHCHALAWQTGDVLLLDNQWIAHGRAPFTGDRKVLVAMSGSLGPREIGS